MNEKKMTEIDVSRTLTRCLECSGVVVSTGGNLRHRSAHNEKHCVGADALELCAHGYVDCELCRP